MFTAESFNNLNIPENIKPTLAALSNASITQSTWSTYQTSAKKLQEFHQETGTNIEWPISQETCLAFVGWLLDAGLAATTVESYLSGLKKCHLTMGLNPPECITPLISTVLKGKKNLDNGEKILGNKSSRIPITPNILKYIKLEIKDSKYSKHDKNLLWATCTICFSGGLRCGEILCKKKNSFDPATDMLHKFIELKTINAAENLKIVQLTLRSEKQNKSGTPTICDIYPSKSSICPVRAFIKWQNCRNFSQDDLPAFRWENGDNLTTRELNSFLQSTLKPFLQGTNKTVSGHSLRIGLASMLGVLGFADEDVMALGRWSSRVFKHYLQLPRTRRLEVARAIGNL